MPAAVVPVASRKAVLVAAGYHPASLMDPRAACRWAFEPALAGPLVASEFAHTASAYLSTDHRFDCRQPAARAPSSEQNQRSPLPSLILVRL